MLDLATVLLTLWSIAFLYAWIRVLMAMWQLMRATEAEVLWHCQQAVRIRQAIEEREREKSR